MVLIARVLVWLSRSAQGLSFLLAFASYGILVVIGTHSPLQGGPLNSPLLFPIFKAGFLFGTVVFPGYRTPGTAGFFLAPLCGALAQLLLFMAVWFAVIRVARWARPEKRDEGSPLNPSL
jgi:hypothetical protein